MSKRRPIPPSEAQINAEALRRREHPLSETHAASVQFNWHYETRIPDDLRGMVRAARRAYADEVPTKLHEGPDSIGEGGTPKMTAQALRYLDAPHATDAPPGERPLASHHLTPFRAALDRMERGGLHRQKRGRIVRHITIGSQDPAAAAIAEGVPVWCASVVAEDALRAFLRGLTDVKVDLHREPEAA